MKQQMPDQDWDANCLRMLDSLFREGWRWADASRASTASRLVKKIKYLPLALDPAAIAVMKAIKLAVRTRTISQPRENIPVIDQ